MPSYEDKQMLMLSYFGKVNDEQLYTQTNDVLRINNLAIDSNYDKKIHIEELDVKA